MNALLLTNKKLHKTIEYKLEEIDRIELVQAKEIFSLYDIEESSITQETAIMVIYFCDDTQEEYDVGNWSMHFE